jgi:hypothetical protein
LQVSIDFLYLRMQILNKAVKKIKGIADTEYYQCIECQVNPAEIFQINGEYCLECWQEITHTNP